MAKLCLSQSGAYTFSAAATVSRIRDKRLDIHCSVEPYARVASYAASAAMMSIYNNVWRSLSSMYLDDMSPSQHMAVMMATAVTVVAVLVGGCWTYRQRRGSSDSSADSPDNLQADGNIIISHHSPLLEYFISSNYSMVFRIYYVCCTCTCYGRST